MLLRVACQIRIPEYIFQLPPLVENLMQTARVAAFVYGTDLHLILSSVFHSHGGTTLHLREKLFGTEVARRHREQPMAGTFTSIYGCEVSLPIREICATYCAIPSRARRRKNNRSVTRLAESSLEQTPISTFQSLGIHSEVHCRTTTLQSPCSH